MGGNIHLESLKKKELIENSPVDAIDWQFVFVCFLAVHISTYKLLKIPAFDANQ